ncbi:MAG: hypothetical protein AAF620_17950 [Bacteroidota bacterium]
MPYLWKDRWKMGGIGSKRMIIEDISEGYQKYLNAEHYLSYANIELRPKGIIVHFRYKLQAYAWIMPFDELEIVYDKFLTLNVTGKFIVFSTGIEQKFINKMIAAHKSYLYA